MRWTAAAVAALLLAGCSSKGGDPAADVAADAADLVPGNATQTVFPLHFAGGTREGELPISETFAATDACLFGFPDCLGQGERTYDLTPIVPADVPVEMSIEISGDADLDVGFEMADAQFIQSDESESGSGWRIDAVLVRAASGTVGMTVTFGFPGPGSAQGATITGNVHTVTRADVVPPLLPVAIRLGPGDTVNATADGLEQFVAFPPSGQPLRALQYPFTVTVPADGATGTWFLVGEADEALRLTGPNRTVSARLLDLVETEPVDVPPNQATTFAMDVPGQPLVVGIGIGSKDLPAGFFGGASVLGNHQVSLRSPGNVEVLGVGTVCTPLCDFALIGNTQEGYMSEFLHEHLTPGTYEATVTMETSNDLTAYGWALAIRAEA